MSSKTVKVVGWQPQRAPPKNECQAMRQIVVEAVMSLYNELHEYNGIALTDFSVGLQPIYRRCQLKVRQRRADGTWDFPYRGKRTWDRRVNEAASPEHGAKIVAATAGKYRPNEKLFQET